MEYISTSAAILALTLLFIGMGLWVFAGIIAVGAASLMIFGDFSLARIGNTLFASLWASARVWEYSAIPLFIWMGEILLRANISEHLFRGVAPWVSWLPGRLLHTTVAACTVFASVTGSSTATAVTVGRNTLPALRERKYPADLAMGSLAAAAGIGILIPPSIALIIYGVLSGVSVSKLFVAGFLPGLLLAVLFSGYMILIGLLKPSIFPQDDITYTWKERFASLLHIAPIAFVMIVVMGSLYAGIATPSEAAAMGVFASVVATALMRRLSFGMLRQSLVATVQMSSMILMILVAASFLGRTLGFLHVPQETAQYIGSLDLEPWQLLIIMSLFYVALGCLLDGVSLIVMTLPIVAPLMAVAGFDPIWFGIYLVLMIEISMITPPVGFNLFVVQGMTGYPLGRVAVAALPFFGCMLLALLVIYLVPGVVLWLPSVLLGS